MRFSAAVAIACFSIGGLSAADDVKAAIRKDTNIPAQGLGPALQTLAKEHGFQIVYVADEVNSLRTQGASGELTSEEALTQLLNDTGLTYRAFGDNAVGIVSIAAAVAGSSLPSGREKGQQVDEASSLPVQGRGTEEREEGKNGKNSEGQEIGKSFWSRFRLAQLDQGQASNDRSAERSDTASKKRSARIEEVIVTARRRAETIQDVPIAIAVVSADEIDRRGLVSAEDYLRGIPSVSQTEIGWGGQAVVIRGVETNLSYQNFGAGSTTAIYFGETPTTASAGPAGSNVDIKLVDIERVEVLRGPQGTAFGDASIGGAVRTIPVSPKLDQFEGKVSAGYSVTSGTGGDNYNGQAVGNIPLIKDRLAIRGTAYAFSDSGYYRNRAGSDPAFQAIAAAFGAQAFATDEEEVGAYYSAGARIAALFQASNDLRFTLSYLTQNNETDGWATATSGTYEQTIFRVAPEHVRRGEEAGIADNQIDIANAVLEYDLGWADLLATYSYLKSGITYMHPYSETQGLLWAASDLRETDVRGDVGEIRLATKFDGTWNFLAGLYAQSSDSEYVTDIYWHGDPATNFFAPGERLLFDYIDRRDLTQNSAFGEASWEFLPGLTLNGGVRAYEYDSTIQAEQSGVFAGGTPPHTRNGTEASGTNFRANLSYEPHDDMLLYAGWAQGFRLGKPQQPLPAGLCDQDSDGLIDGTNVTIESTARFESDAVDSYELGGKFAAFDRRLIIDTAVFRMDWSDIPVLVQPPCLSAYTTNAGAARSEGVEFQANVHVTDAFRVDVGGSWINARLTTDVPAQGFSAGDRLPGAPKVNANLSAQYEFDIGGRATSLRADAIYIGPLYSRVGQSPNDKAGDYVRLDATARVTIANLNIDIYGRNLTNEDAFTMRGNLGGESHGYRMRPRTIGVQFGYDF